MFSWVGVALGRGCDRTDARGRFCIIQGPDNRRPHVALEHVNDRDGPHIANMKILVLDPYPDRPWRISKDTNGGYGTANRFGDGVVSRLLTWLMSREVDWPPLHAVHTMGVLRDQGHDVSYARRIPDGATPDLCLVASSIVCHETELGCISELAGRGVPVGAIGPFATSMPAPYVDAGAFVIAGEPELYFFANPVTPDTVAAMTGVVPANANVDLDALPLPAWDLVFAVAPPKFGLLNGKHVPLPVTATRGCPYSCFNYCVYPLQQGRKVRKRAPEKVVAEMEYWSEKLGITYFIFRDPVFSLDRNHTLALCDALEQSDKRFSFAIETHLRNVDEELARRLVAVGLDMVKVGIESTNADAVKESKRYSIEEQDQIDRVRMLEGLGVKVTCFYIVGMPGDTPQNFAKTMRFAQDLNTEFAQISVFTPYPGTPAFGGFADQIVVDEYQKFTQYDLVFQHDVLSAGQIRKMLSQAYHDYYLRPRWLMKYLSARFS